ncbi:MAG: hypothetical protein WB611_27820 [Stellaceae bacterium]
MPKAKIMVVLAGFAATAIFANFFPARADELNDLRSNQSSIQSRIDQLARPADPQTNAPAAPVPNVGGSFPRSFVIPGTDTSVRVGGDVDETMGYHAH